MCSPDPRVNVARNRPRRAINQFDLNGSRVIAAGCNHGERRLTIDSVPVVLPRIEVTVIGDSGIDALHVRIRWQRGRDPLPMHAAIRPFRMPGIFEIRCGSDNHFCLRHCGRNGRSGRASFSPTACPCLDFADKQYVTGSVVACGCDRRIAAGTRRQHTIDIGIVVNCPEQSV